MDVVRFSVLFLVTQQFAYGVNAVTLTSSSDKATVGSNFTFTCVTNSRAITFQRDDNSETTIIGGYTNGSCHHAAEYNMDYTYQCNNSTGVYNLTIPSSFNIDTLHGSSWKCVLPLESGKESKPIQLYVIVPITQVTITAVPTDRNPTEIILDKNQNFSCTTNAGRPSSRIQWYISGTNITVYAVPLEDNCSNNCMGKVKSSSELIYTGIKSDDGKIVYCTAVNIIGHSVKSENKSIVIWYGSSNVTISPSKTIYTVNASTGSVGPVDCIPYGCKPTCTVKWSGPDLLDNTSSALNLQNISRNKAGDYVCIASNVAWSQTSKKISIIVNYGPEQVTISPVKQNYTVSEITGIVGPINCTAECKPECTMTWSGPNIPYGTTSVLNLQNINRKHAGKYQCNATNMICSQISVIVNIIVNYGPGLVSISPNTLVYMVTETTGNVGPITCTAYCNPTCLVTWTGPNIHDGALSILHLEEIDRNHAGSYICTASNSYGNKTSSAVSVIVNYGPREVAISPKNMTYTAAELKGNVGPIRCEADCKPECTLIWNGPSFLADIASVLHLQNISKTQAGDYSCNASNNVGSLTSVTVSVIVNYGPDAVNILPEIPYYTVNETGSVNDVSCTANCQPNCTMTWKGPNLTGSDTSVLSLHNIARNQSGTYQCNASNSVGSQTSLRIKITVNFRPAVGNIFGNKSFHENDTVTFLCRVESVPTASINWFFKEYILADTNIVFINETLISDNNYHVSILNISRIGCLSMGSYTCAANNIIGENMKSIEIEIECSPRINEIEYNVQTLIAVKDNEPLNITAPIIAFPEPNICWTFVNNETFVNLTHKASTIVIRNRIFSSLYIENVTETDFGHYRIYAINGIGSNQDYIHSFEVIPKRKPNSPDNVTCTGRPYSILIHWKSTFNGGDTQVFKIFMKKDGGSTFYAYGQSFSDPGRNTYVNAAINQLTPDTTYHFKVQAINKHNFSMSVLTSCNTSSSVVDDQQQTSAVAIGAGTGVGGAIIVLVIVAVVFKVIRRRKINEKIGQDKEPMQRSDEIEDYTDDDGLKENPLYVSSLQEATGTVYSIVDKARHNLNKGKDKPSNENSVYTQVIKTNKKDLRNKEIEMGCIYQNSGDITKGQIDEVYTNSEVKGNFGNKHDYIPKKNKDGLIYADLDLAPTMSGKRFVIRGLENRNNYAVIDLTKKAEPLSSDSDSDDDKTKTNIEEE